MTPLVAFLLANPVAFVAIVFVLGLLIGSFLNVVIHRLPIMIERDWRKQCDESAGKPTKEEPRFDLVVPRSRCPGCGHPISALENIPLLSFAVLGGRCKSCRKPISWRYPIVELITGALSAMVAWRFGVTVAALGALLLTWALIALTFIDYDCQLLPDSITLPWLWLGLLFNIGNVYVTLVSAVIGAIAGYVSLWSVYKLFKLITGREGMGYGDFKLFAALGAWLGWQQLPLIILASSFIGAIIGLGGILMLGRDRQVPIPFGPFLCLAGWVALLWGDAITSAYLHFARI